MKIFVDDSKYLNRVTHATGYAEIHRQLILHFSALGIEVGFPPLSEAELAASPLPADVKTRLGQIARRSFVADVDTVQLQVATPDSFVKRPGRFNVGLTMTERESLAGYLERFDWVGLCNAMDLILTPTEWNRAVFARHGILGVQVAGLGIDSVFFTPRPVAFLSVLTGFGHPSSRANWQEIVDAFTEEFRGQRGVTLTIVSSASLVPFRYAGVGDAVRRLPTDLLGLVRAGRSSEGPEIALLEGGRHTHEEMREIYRRHDAYISYSREGWGFPLLEAMACGLDVIAPRYGAPLAYLEGSPARLFDPGRLTDDGLSFEGGDIAALRGHLRDIYEARRRTRLWTERLSWSRAAEEILRILRERHADWLAGRSATSSS
jgi:glycosyltransferase involved in cell wall biosynthesis